MMGAVTTVRAVISARGVAGKPAVSARTQFKRLTHVGKDMRVSRFSYIARKCANW